MLNADDWEWTCGGVVGIDGLMVVVVVVGFASKYVVFRRPPRMNTMAIPARTSGDGQQGTRTRQMKREPSHETYD